MIIVKLKGGLANQMFQYAFGYALAKRNKLDFLYDNSFFKEEQKEAMTIRELGINAFNISYASASKIQINQAKGWYANPIKRKLNSIYNRFQPYYQNNIFKEQHPHYDVNSLNPRKDSYFIGFWQSEKYFKDFRNEIVNEFALKEKLSFQSQEVLNLIVKSNSIAIHVRRGDYVNNPHYNKIHHILGKEYYQKGCSIINDNQINAQFFIFSDDIEWCKKNFDFIDNPIFIENWENKPAYEDLILMKNCKHNIIANSTYSWWAAWLNENEGKMVVAPEKWYKLDSLENKDITPESWTVI